MSDNSNNNDKSTSEPRSATSITIDIVTKENLIKLKNSSTAVKKSSANSSHSETIKSISGSSLESKENYLSNKSFLSKLVEEVSGDSNSDINDDSSSNLNINDDNLSQDNEQQQQQQPQQQQSLLVRSFQSIKEIDTIYEDAQEIA